MEPVSAGLGIADKTRFVIYDNIVMSCITKMTTKLKENAGGGL